MTPVFEEALVPERLDPLVSSALYRLSSVRADKGGTTAVPQHLD
jgi:hypothetical protein